MKKFIKNPAFLFLFFVMFSSQISLSQDDGEGAPPSYFNTGSISTVDWGGQNATNYFSLQEISTSRLDVGSSLNSTDFTLTYRLGKWAPNNGSGSLGSPSSAFYSENPSQYDLNQFRGMVAVRLRNSTTKKDIVTIQNDNMRVFWNNNNTITGQQQSFSVSSSYIEKGSFNQEDTYEDIIIVQSNGIKVYYNQYDGYLNTTPYSFTCSATKIKLKQINEHIFFPSNTSDRDDLILISNGYVKVYLNTGSNTFNSSAFADINTGMSYIQDLFVEDVNNDGYNDIIVASNDNVAKVYLNNLGSSVDGTADWTLSSSSYIPSLPLIFSKDINKDGYNDLVFVGAYGHTSVFINTASSGLFNSTSEQTFSSISGWGTGASVFNKIEGADMYNTGGIALVASYGTYTKMMNSTNFDPAPPPPSVRASHISSGNFYHPKIHLKNRDERDFNTYKIYKLDTGDVSYQYIGSTSGDNYVDYTENIFVGPGELQSYGTISYKVTMVDNSSQESGFSKQMNYVIHSDYLPDTYSENTETIMGITPDKYALENYPNPFNPVTKVYYLIPQEGFVNITVYNYLGQVVSVLVNKHHSTPGAYYVDFNGSNLASGIYFCRIQTGNFVQTKRMMLIK
ncbi:MAG TPA: T9SS type A sorting domain-containing protein [Ignavibacteria bacterium]|nr:T9SS type A sorting domain-containing protein [Ignavibacteria bacterium]